MIRNIQIFETKSIKSGKFKFCVLLIIISIIFYEQNIIYLNLNINNSLENDIKKYFCELFIFENNYNCYKEIFINDNFFYDVKSVSKNKHLLIKEKNTKIINFFLLIALIPFYKSESKLFYKINKKDSISIYINKYGEKINNNLIKLKTDDFGEKQNELINLLNYEWEIIPSIKIINFLRYIINNFYYEDCLTIFDTSLNLNYKLYIEKNRNNIPLKMKSELISKKNI